MENLGMRFGLLQFTIENIDYCFNHETFSGVNEQTNYLGLLTFF